ncbi:uncharacterized protein LOC129980800 [Argiope bruennichi]|uniref:uncharacterized protein LOC129980800 n=1 Tax=Argiope bruennichi TaxID=94029 RepID=UPI002493FDAC|nr:uncharacterized protein LOC129980800 [Argiope bruennichi]
MKTRLAFREDTQDFKFSMILPSDHPVVTSLIISKHKELLHCGIQTLIARLREKYRILKARKTIRKVIRKCVICKRFNARYIEVMFALLPEDRIKDAFCFEVTGIDLAGPVFLRDGSKSWIVSFTSSVFRAVHLKLVASTSTDKFLLALRRFRARRGMPAILYTDNCKNFVGTEHLLKRVNWDQVVTYGAASRIIWKFIPPSSPW